MCLNDKASTALYHDVDETTAKFCLDTTVKQSLNSFRSPCRHGTNEIMTKKVYITTVHDQAVPYVAQQIWSQSAEAEVVLLDCGHSPFMKKADASMVIDTVTRIAQNS